MNTGRAIRGPAGGRRELAPLLAAFVAAAVVAGAAGEGFSLGVASGDVTDTTAIVWTRADRPGPLRYELARDDDFARLERSGLAHATPEHDLTVKVELTGLAPATGYCYRFCDPEDPQRRSRVGRFRTAPDPQQAAPLRFAFCGDASATRGPLAVFAALAAEEPDFLVWFGDTIYADDPAAADGTAQTLADYRRKYRRIRADPYVQEALARFPLWTGWDDHEVRDNYAGAEGVVPAEQLAAAYQAFFEYMPIREQRVGDDPFRTYRGFRWGSTVELFLLDGRQYRDPRARECHANPDPFGVILEVLAADGECAAALSAERTLLGDEQFAWLTSGLADSSAAAKFVINDVPLSFLGLLPYDRWDGYDAERRELLEFIDRRAIEGVVFLTTDFHSSWYNPDVLRYFREQRPDYALRCDVTIVEAIVGPVGVATLHESLLELAAGLLGHPLGPLMRCLLNSAEDRVVRRLERVGGFSLAETNRVSYLVVEVSESGLVELRYRGLRPARRNDTPPPIETFYTASLSSDAADQRPGTVPCLLPVAAVALPGLALGSRWPQRVARLSSRRCSRFPRSARATARGLRPDGRG